MKVGECPNCTNPSVYIFGSFGNNPWKLCCKNCDYVWADSNPRDNSELP